MTYIPNIAFRDSANLDSFSRLRGSLPETVFSIQHQYSKATLQMDSGATGSGVTPLHNSNARMVALATNAGSGESWTQSFMYCPYQPGKSQFFAGTFVIGAAVANTNVNIGYFDTLNGVMLRQNGVNGLQMVRRTSTSGSVVEEVVNQADWNVDKFDGTGPSGKTVDVTRAQIFMIDLQFLGMGRVRTYFDIDGCLCEAHRFNNANNLVVPYMQSATLPVQMQVIATGSVATKTAYCKCFSVNSEGGNLDLLGYTISTPEVAVTAASGARTPILSIRPKTTFSGVPNRQYFEILDLSMIVTGTNPVYWEVVAGATLAGTAWADVNTAWSGLEYTSTPGSLSSMVGSLVVASGYTAGAGGGVNPPTVSPIELPRLLSMKIPLSLDRAGAQRLLGTYTVLVSGIGAASACRATINYKETR